MSNRIKALEEQIGEKRNALLAINTKCENESRSRTEEEKKEWDSLKSEIANLDDELRSAKEAEEVQKAAAKQAADAARAAGGSADTGEKKEIEKHKKAYSMRNAFAALIKGEKLEGRELEMHQEAEREMRGHSSLQGVGVPSFMVDHTEKRTDVDQATSAIQPTVVGGYVDALRENSIFERAGATVLSGLTADYKIPVVAGQSLAWASAENSAAADGGANFTSKTLDPATRLTGYVDVSNMIMLQNGDAPFAAVMRDLGRETANKINDALFSTTNVSNAIPSIAATSGVGTFTEALYSANASIHSDFVEAEQTLADAEGLNGNLAYVAATNLMNDLKKSAQVTSILAAFGTSIPTRGTAQINGYDTYFTTSCTSSAGVSGDFIFGDFSKVYVGYFGGLDMVRDPYSSLLNDQTRIVVHRRIDAALVQGAAFVKATSLVA